MDAEGADFTPFRYSADDLPERDRLPAWRDFFGSRMLGAELEPLSDEPLHAGITGRQLPGVCLMSAVSSPIRFSWTTQFLGDGRDDVGLQINSAGGTLSLGGRETTYEAGDAVFVTATEAGADLSPHASRHLCLFVRPDALAPYVPGLEDAVLRRVPANTWALQYLLSYARYLESEKTLSNPELARIAATHLRDLFALVVGASRDAGFVAEGRGLRAARLQAIKRHVADRLGDGGLSVGAVAARHRVTPRYVQRLFEGEGTTFTEYVLEQRLARVRAMLDDPRCAGRTVTEIALAAGFADISYFNRRFRRRYGASPTEVRSGSRAD